MTDAGRVDERWDARGGSLWLDREQWGVVVDALIEHRASTERRKASNPDSACDVRADECAALIGKITGVASNPAALAQNTQVDGEAVDPAACVHRFLADPRVCSRCGWDFRKNGSPPDRAERARVPDGWRDQIDNIANNIGESLNAGCDQDAVDRIGGYVTELFALAAAPPQPEAPTMVESMVEREAFEKWYAGTSFADATRKQRDHDIALAAWQAAHLAPPAQAVGGWMDDAPAELGWYWYWDDEATLMSVHFVFYRPGHAYLCVEGEPYGPAMKRNFIAVETMRGKWARAEAPPLPAPPVPPKESSHE